MEILKTYPAQAISYGACRSRDDIKYIVVHYTGNKTDKAVNNAKYYFNKNTRSAGAHYFVDEKSVYQSISVLRTAYAVGGTKYIDCAVTGGGKMYGLITNKNSISIELCSTKGKIAEATQTLAIDLICKLAKDYNIKADNVYRHFDVNGKPCPGWTGWIKSDDSLWKAFKNKIKTKLDPASPATLTAKVNTKLSPLAVRNADGKKIGSVKKGKLVTVTKKTAVTMKIGKNDYVMSKIDYNGKAGYVVKSYLKF